MSFIIIGITLLILVIVYYWRMPKNLPPGPTRIPVLGHILYMKPPLQSWLPKLAQKYGNVFRLYLGNKLVIFLTDFNSIKETYIKQGDNFSGKPFLPFTQETEDDNFGLVLTEGEYWSQHRRFILRTLRDKGFGKQAMEPQIMHEVQCVMKEVRKLKEKPQGVHGLLAKATANTIHYLITSQRFDYEDEHLTNLLRLFKEFDEISVYMTLVSFLPWTRHIPFLHRLMGSKRRQHVVNQVLDLVKTSIDLNKLNYVDGEVDNYISAFLAEQQERKKKTVIDTIFTEKALHQISRDLLQAGTDTTATLTTWIFLYLSQYPNVQKRAREEVDRAIGQDRDPCYNDRLQTHYVQAIISEVQRCVSLSPLTARKNLKATELFGYTIPKDTMFMASTWSVHNDPKLWGDPENFRPERFLDNDGNFLKPEYLMPFSLGKRQCLGESLAVMELYLFVTTFLQQFEFLPVEGVNLDIHENSTFIQIPKHDLICAKRRTLQKQDT